MPKINNIGESTPTLVAHPTREALAADAVGRSFDILEHVLTERTVAHVHSLAAPWDCDAPGVGGLCSRER